MNASETPGSGNVQGRSCILSPMQSPSQNAGPNLEPKMLKLALIALFVLSLGTLAAAASFVPAPDALPILNAADLGL